MNYSNRSKTEVGDLQIRALRLRCWLTINKDENEDTWTLVREEYERLVDEIHDIGQTEFPKVIFQDENDKLGKVNHEYFASLSDEDKEMYQTYKWEETSTFIDFGGMKDSIQLSAQKCEHGKNKLSIIDERVHCVCGVSWPKELTRHFTILKNEKIRGEN